MTISKKYIHDRVVLLLLTVSVFLSVLGSILILLKLDTDRNQGYITQYRANLGVSAFKVGHMSDLMAFMVFFALVLVINTVLSIRVYNIHRQFSVAILGLGLLLIILAIIVSNTLLVLR